MRERGVEGRGRKGRRREWKGGEAGATTKFLKREGERGGGGVRMLDPLWMGGSTRVKAGIHGATLGKSSVIV